MPGRAVSAASSGRLPRAGESSRAEQQSPVAGGGGGRKGILPGQTTTVNASCLLCTWPPFTYTLCSRHTVPLPFTRQETEHNNVKELTVPKS